MDERPGAAWRDCSLPHVGVNVRPMMEVMETIGADASPVANGDGVPPESGLATFICRAQWRQHRSRELSRRHAVHNPAAAGGAPRGRGMSEVKPGLEEGYSWVTCGG